MARPKIKIEQSEFEKLCSYFCTETEIADFFGCSPDTISRWCVRTYSASFADTIKRLSAPAKRNLRKFQLAAAYKGNTAMLIWLGKQYLGQKDKSEISTDEIKPFTLAYSLKDLKDD